MFDRESIENELNSQNNHYVSIYISVLHNFIYLLTSFMTFISVRPSVGNYLSCLTEAESTQTLKEYGKRTQ